MNTEQTSKRPAIRTVGLLGGVASGKSFVASLLGELGAVVLDGDRAGHEVLEEPEVIAAARERWGEAIFSADGHIDRKALGRIVFASSPAGRRDLEFLEQRTHPRIGARLLAQVQAAAEQGAPLAVLDAAVMRKAGWNKFCDKIVMVDAPQAVRLARARSRGWTDAEFAARSSSGIVRRKAGAGGPGNRQLGFVGIHPGGGAPNLANLDWPRICVTRLPFIIQLKVQD